MAREGKGAAFSSRVRPHVHGCVGYIVAFSGDCLEIQRKEAALETRTFRPLAVDGLHGLELPDSWLMGVVLCPGDETTTLGEWVRGLPPQAVDRIRFYYLPGVDLTGALSGWYAAGLPDARTADVKDWGTFHHEFGWDHANQIDRDLSRHPEWFTTKGT